MGGADKINALVGGKDCRTDTLTEGLASSPMIGELSGISEIRPPGMLERCSRFRGGVSLTDIPGLLEFVEENPIKPDLIVFGPEEPLGAGAVDQIESRLGIKSFGPYQAHARIETSKSWARELITNAGIPGNPEHRVIHHPGDLQPYFRKLGEFVVKPDGLTGGKGVKLSGEHLKSLEESLDYAKGLIEDDGVVLIEERLEGEEFSLQTITDGQAAVHCPLVQDHKRAGEDDTGPNTGGMGSYSYPDHSLPFIADEDVSLAKSINERVIAELGERLGRPYRGVLYGGFMATASGLRLIEYNARFGDPEAMNVLSILDGDLLETCWAAANDRLGEVRVGFKPLATVCKYVVPERYPTGKGAGDLIDCTDLYPELGEDVRLYWAAVNCVGGSIKMTSSRALAVVGIGSTVAEAEAKAERAAGLVRGPVRHRKDIGTERLIARRVQHMHELQGQSVRSR